MSPRPPFQPLALPIPFFKGHALGNDYICLDSADLPWPFTAGRARMVCDRHAGVGSDGVLLKVAAENADYGLRIFNPDGSEAEKSGNGLRIFGAWLSAHRGARASFTVSTPGGLSSLEVVSSSERESLLRASMGRPLLTTAAVGMIGPDQSSNSLMLDVGGEQLDVTLVSVGNPHCVLVCDQLDVARLRTVGPALEHHSSFPFGINVQLARVVDSETIEILIWERGAGETSASGSSACAAATALRSRGLIHGSEIRVLSPGGELTVSFALDGEVHLEGPVVAICTGHLEGQLMERLRMQQ